MKHIPFLLGALLLVGVAACDDKSDEGSGQQSQTIPVAFTSEVIAMEQTTASWNDGDPIGIYMVQSGTNRIVGNASNAAYKAAASGSLSAAGEPIHYSSDYKTFDFFAYYPYRAEVKNYIVPIDLADQSNLTASCLLYSNNAAGVAEQEGAVKLSFTHKLAKIAFTITPGSGLTLADLAGVTMTVEGLNSQADFNIRNGLLSNRRTPGTAAATVAADGKSAQFVTLPAADQHFKLHFTLRNKLTFDWETDKTFTFGEGKIHNLRVTIGNSAVEVTPGDIEDWTGIDTPPTTGDADELDPPKAYAVGDLYPDATAPEGIVFQISDNGVHGKVVGLVEFKQRWGAYPKAEATDGVPEAANVDDGYKATVNLISIRRSSTSFAKDYAIFNWLYTTVNGSDAEGKWYIPAKNELRALLAGISGLDYNQIAAAWTDNVAMPNLSTTAAARDAFNKKITDAGGTKLNLWGTYWTSTELDSEHPWCVKFDTGLMVNSKFKYDEWGPTARPILAF